MPASWYVVMRNVVVTGGSRGLGLGIARKLTTELGLSPDMMGYFVPVVLAEFA